MATAKKPTKLKYLPIVEKEFSNLPILRFDKFLKKKMAGMSLEEFIENFFSTFNEEHNTKNPETDKVETTMGKHRSINDVYSICKYYYPKVILEEVFVAIFENCKKNKVFGKWFCKSTKRYVFSSQTTDYDALTVRDEPIYYGSDITLSNIYRELGYKPSDFVNDFYDKDDDDDN